MLPLIESICLLLCLPNIRSKRIHKNDRVYSIFVQRYKRIYLFWVYIFIYLDTGGEEGINTELIICKRPFDAGLSPLMMYGV
jgi:hypothetical protein